MLDETERMALVLGALDAAIANLTTVRDLLAVSLMNDVAPMEIPAVEPTGECAHRDRITITTMGVQQTVCPDCDQVLDG